MTEEPGSPERRRRKKLALRRQIRRAALDLFIQQGFADTTVEQIAVRADVAAMTVYRHFGTKEAIVVSVALEDDLESVWELVGGNLAVPRLVGDFLQRRDRDWLTDMADRARVIHTNPELLRALDAQTSPWVAALVQRYGADTLLGRIQARNFVSALIEGFLAWSRDGAFPSRDALAHNVETALGTLETFPTNRDGNQPGGAVRY